MMTDGETAILKELTKITALLRGMYADGSVPAARVDAEINK